MRSAPQEFQERRDPKTGEKYLVVSRRGSALKDDSLLSKGTCFTLEERQAFGLSGLFPPAVSTPDEQAARAYGNDYSVSPVDDDDNERPIDEVIAELEAYCLDWLQERTNVLVFDGGIIIEQF